MKRSALLLAATLAACGGGSDTSDTSGTSVTSPSTATGAPTSSSAHTEVETNTAVAALLAWNDAAAAVLSDPRGWTVDIPATPELVYVDGAQQLQVPLTDTGSVMVVVKGQAIERFTVLVPFGGDGMPDTATATDVYHAVVQATGGNPAEAPALEDLPGDAPNCEVGVTPSGLGFGYLNETTTQQVFAARCR